jgi:hypothetical protein
MKNRYFHPTPEGVAGYAIQREISFKNVVHLEQFVHAKNKNSSVSYNFILDSFESQIVEPRINIFLQENKFRIVIPERNYIIGLRSKDSLSQDQEPEKYVFDFCQSVKDKKINFGDYQSDMTSVDTELDEDILSVLNLDISRIFEHLPLEEKVMSGDWYLEMDYPIKHFIKTFYKIN